MQIQTVRTEISFQARARLKRRGANRATGSAPPTFLLKAKGNRFGADIRGAAAVEFALILWPLLLLLLGTVDGGRMLWTQNSLQYAVEQAAPCTRR